MHSKEQAASISTAWYDRRARFDLASPGSLFTHNIEARWHTERRASLWIHLPGWKNVTIQATPNRGLSLAWAQPVQGPEGLQVEVQVQPETENNALHWQLNLSAPGEGWALWRVVFPQAVFHKPGEHPSLLLPGLSGQLCHDAWDTDYHHRANYSAGWVAPVPFTAIYGEDTGLYWGIHDPMGSTREMAFDGDPQTHTLRLAFDHPIPGMGIPETEYSLPGKVIWQLFRGDWFDATLIYKNWVSQHARWFPQSTGEGRSDTPLWLRELSVWVSGDVKTHDGQITAESLVSTKKAAGIFWRSTRLPLV